MHSAQTWLGLQGLGGGCRGSAGQTLVFVSDRGCLGPWAGEPGEESAQSLERSHGGSHEGGSGQGERGSPGGGVGAFGGTGWRPEAPRQIPSSQLFSHSTGTYCAAC